ncbi:hypothetical protein BYT27DRAFT_7174959 [Phlegmacium glaucopus]|nr:hypothetical protein BYT27DRAFT_7174959 [Phlegmacium glaucopus]
MYSKIFVSALFSLRFAVAAVATPQPHLEERQDPTPSITNFPWTPIGAATEAGSFNSFINEIFTSVFEVVTTVDGKTITIITSEGGEAFTLATSGAGVVTSAFGSVFTVATTAVASGTSGAFVPYAVQTSLLVGLGSVIVGAFLGAVITL